MVYPKTRRGIEDLMTARDPGRQDAGESEDRPSALGLFASARAWNIALRTAHIAASGVLLGGHAFGLPAERLHAPLYWTVGTGVALAMVESGASLVWFHQGRGLATLAKLALLLAVPWCWSWRFPILLVVVVLASVGSHMPARLRYYSVLYRRVIACRGGPGTAAWKDSDAEPDPAPGPKPDPELRPSGDPA